MVPFWAMGWFCYHASIGFYFTKHTMTAKQILQTVTGEWLEKKMQAYELEGKQISENTGVPRPNISAIKNESRGAPYKSNRIILWFYFRNLELEKEIKNIKKKAKLSE